LAVASHAFKSTHCARAAPFDTYPVGHEQVHVLPPSVVLHVPPLPHGCGVGFAALHPGTQLVPLNT
jgi:hypothetical protein